MKLKLLAVGNKMPAWVNQGFAEYSKRMPRDMRLELVEVPLGNRSKNSDVRRAMEQETECLFNHIQPRDHVIALEVRGKSWTTERLADNMNQWRQDGNDVVLLVGGPDGLSDACRERAQQLWSLSDLTLPHPIVRVVLSEQLYRAWTITQNHPYHRS